MYSPRWLFLIPGLALMILGLALMAWLLPAERPLGHVNLGVDTLAYAAAAVLLGFQLVFFGVAAKVFATTEDAAEDPSFRPLVPLHRNPKRPASSRACCCCSSASAVISSVVWAHTGCGPLPVQMVYLRDAVPHARHRSLLRQLLPQPPRPAETLNFHQGACFASSLRSSSRLARSRSIRAFAADRLYL